MSRIAVERIQVKADRVVFDVRIDDPTIAWTNEAIAARAAAARPNLPIHACVNSKGSTFGCVMSHTPLPHLIEHCIIDMLVEDSVHELAEHMGTSRWTDEDSGRARIQISMKDDLEVLRAFKRAIAFIEEEVLVK